MNTFFINNTKNAGILITKLYPTKELLIFNLNLGMTKANLSQFYR